MFSEFGEIVNRSFQSLMDGPVYTVDIEPDILWEAYLASFPEGSNPIFKKRTEHDCSCCKQFIRRVGNITDGSKTVWDEAALIAPEPFRVVARDLRDLIKSKMINNLFMIVKNEKSFGTRESHSQSAKDGPIIKWNHFYTGDIPPKFRNDAADSIKGDYRTSVQVFERGLKELNPVAIETVIELIEAKSLYRGEEHLSSIMAFKKVQIEYEKSKNKHRFVWEKAGDLSVSRFRNTVIGSLIIDISDGMEVENAVKSFEAKVAPQNYKRTTSLITPMMVKKAMATITELGLESALERRFANLRDVNINDVKWADNTVKNVMKGSLEGLLMKEALSPISFDNAVKTEIFVDEFLNMLKDVKQLDVFLTGKHLGNLVSLTAPINPEPKQLFKWNNDFSWSYTGNVADSIKERVKKAGGKVTGKMRVSLSWFNYDDLDLHIHEPSGRGMNTFSGEIYFGHRVGHTGGVLDVDMNAGSGTTREAVENVCWSNKPPDGRYKVVVNNYRFRESTNPGFVIEVESEGKLHNFSYNKSVLNGQNINVCALTVKNGIIVSVDELGAGITSTMLSQDKWGLKTESFVKCNVVTLSPNYWGENKVGNKHLFLILDGCISDEQTRGIYNEFLNSRLESHRKVFEVIGDKTRCAIVPDQLSGLGFSSTVKESVLVRVNNKRLYSIQTGG